MDVLGLVAALSLGGVFAAYYALRPRFKGVFFERIACLFKLRFEKPFENIVLAGLAGLALESALVLYFGLPEAATPLNVTAFLLLLSGFCAPLWEESVFRGVFFEFPKRVGWHVGDGVLLVVSVLVFAAFHDYSLLSSLDLFNQRVVGLLAAGSLYGGLYLRDRNLLPAMVAHGAGNVFVVLLRFAGY